MKKFLPLVLLFSLLAGILALAGCNDGDTPAAIIPSDDMELAALTYLRPIWDIPPQPEPETMACDARTVNLLQLSPLTHGELLVTMHTSMGDIILRFFPTEAPLAVENFLTHAWNGYYDGLTFHRVMENFMIQGGCPSGTGLDGESIWGEPFAQELSSELRHFRGALAMAQPAAHNAISSQFYIVQNHNLNPHYRSEFASFLELQDEPLQPMPDGSEITLGDVFPVAALRYFLENGGTPHLDWHYAEIPHTVFGHVVTGMDVVDAIANVATNANDLPDVPVIINGFTFHTYQGGQ